MKKNVLFAIGNDEIDKAPPLGDFVLCQKSQIIRQKKSEIAFFQIAGENVLLLLALPRFALTFSAQFLSAVIHFLSQFRISGSSAAIRLDFLISWDSDFAGEFSY